MAFWKQASCPLIELWKKCPFRIYAIHIKLQQINETKMWDNRIKVQNVSLKTTHGAREYVFPFIWHVGSLYKCPFNNILSFFLDT